MNYNSYHAAVKCHEENRPSRGKKTCLLSNGRMKQHSDLGATCSFKSAVPICFMDFEELQVDMDQVLKKKLHCEVGPSKLFVCISSNGQRHQSRAEMNNH